MSLEILYHCCMASTSTRRPSWPASAVLDPTNQAEDLVRAFGTMTADLLELADWLAAHAVVHVAMESTGVYWKPVFHLLEDRFEILLVNAQHIKQVPGRKTDVKDCEWIAQLLQHGLLRPSFIPPQPIRELPRPDAATQPTGRRTRLGLQSDSESAGGCPASSMSSVASDVLGVSGRAHDRRLIGGETEPDRLADLARRRLREDHNSGKR